MLFTYLLTAVAHSTAEN